MIDTTFIFQIFVFVESCENRKWETGRDDDGTSQRRKNNSVRVHLVIKRENQLFHQ